MNFENFAQACVSNVESFVREHELNNILVRYWLPEDVMCSYGYIMHWVDLGAGKWMIGIQAQHPARQDNRHEAIDYYLLDQIRFEVYKGDQENEDD